MREGSGEKGRGREGEGKGGLRRGGGGGWGRTSHLPRQCECGEDDLPLG